ncbi:MAG: hypothetical protein SFT81_00485 [Candidatus Caenarcaniphilales bacterium]|nr:hypothetical protein [Candidatus Caenarcaniphilales bacterium]
MKSKLSFFLASVLLLVCMFISSQSQSGVAEDPRAVEALAKCLRATRATMYGTSKCGHCLAQKEMFGEYFKYIRFVDCRRDKASSDECYKSKVGKFPQWNFTTTDKVIVREADLDTIAMTSGCSKYIAQALGGQEPTALPETTNNITDTKQTYTASSASSTKVAASPSSASLSSMSSSSGRTSSVYGNTEELAQCLKAKQVIFYGSPNCGHCNKQKDMFEGNFEKYLLASNFHNCKGNAAEKAECDRLNTYPFPSWVEKSTGKKLLGPERSLDIIANTFGCTLEARAVSDPSLANSSDVSSFDNPNKNTTAPIINAQPSVEEEHSLFKSLGLDDKEDKAKEPFAVPQDEGETLQALPEQSISSSVQPAATQSELESSSSTISTTSVAKTDTSPNVVDELTKPLSASPYQQTSNQNNSGSANLIASNPSTSSAGLQQLSPQQIKQMKLATCLSTRNIKLYGITNPSSQDKLHLKSTQEQLQELGVAASKIKVVDCSDGKAECSNLVFPTWILENKMELPGVYDLSNFAQIIGCPID